MYHFYQNEDNYYTNFSYPYCCGYSGNLNNYHDSRMSKDEIKDYGKEPFVIDIEKITKQNNNFRATLWTGDYLQVTLMSLVPGEEIGLESHSETDQFLRVEQGEGIVKMGSDKDKLDFERKVYEGDAFIVPAKTWHNLINTGTVPIKLYSIYAPPHHEKGTIHKTKQDSEKEEM